MPLAPIDGDGMLGHSIGEISRPFSRNHRAIESQAHASAPRNRPLRTPVAHTHSRQSAANLHAQVEQAAVDQSGRASTNSFSAGTTTRGADRTPQRSVTIGISGGASMRIGSTVTPTPRPTYNRHSFS